MKMTSKLTSNLEEEDELGREEKNCFRWKEKRTAEDGSIGHVLGIWSGLLWLECRA